MSQEINSKLEEPLPALSHTFASASPIRHIVINDMLSTDFWQALLDEFSPFDPIAAIEENGNVGRKALHSGITKIGPSYRQLDNLIQFPRFLDLMSHLGYFSRDDKRLGENEILSFIASKTK